MRISLENPTPSRMRADIRGRLSHLPDKHAAVKRGRSECAALQSKRDFAGRSIGRLRENAGSF